MTKNWQDETLHHPYMPDEIRPRGWIQWKGTSVCMDVHCACGVMFHIDAEFAYLVKSPCCGRYYGLCGTVALIEIEPDRLSDDDKEGAVSDG